METKRSVYRLVAVILTACCCLFPLVVSAGQGTKRKAKESIVYDSKPFDASRASLPPNYNGNDIKGPWGQVFHCSMSQGRGHKGGHGVRGPWGQVFHCSMFCCSARIILLTVV